MVSKRQIQNSALQPNLRKTPRGGKIMAKMISTTVAAAIFPLPTNRSTHRERERVHQGLLTIGLTNFLYSPK